MNLLSTFSSGTTISSSAVNADLTDIASEITNSVAKDGQTAMTGAVKGADGTVSLPGYAFNSDTNTGIYRIGSDDVGFACGGSKVFEWTATGVAATGTLSVSGILTATGAVNLSDGTVGTPGLNFTSDTDSGLYRIGTNNVGVGVNGAKVLDVGTGGLGIVGVTSLGDGAVGTPGLNFTSDTDSGLYRIGANNVGLAVNGAKVLDVATTGLTVVGALTSTTFTLPAGSFAAQSDYETATSTTLVTAPGKLHFHPGHPKAWAFVLQGTTAITTDYGCASVSDDGTAKYTLTFDTAFSSTSAYTCGGAFARATGSNAAIVNSSESAGAKTGSTFAHITKSTADNALDSVESSTTYVGDL